MSGIVDLKKTPQKSDTSAPIREVQAFQPMSWEAPEFTEYEKSRVWYIALFGVAALLVLAMVLVKNYIAAALFVLLAPVVYLASAKKPRVLNFGISGKGVQIGDRLYPYDDLQSFWIFYEPHMDRAELSLRSRKAVMPYVRLPLGSQNPAVVHALLSRFLPERKHADSVVDAMARRAGF